MSRKQKTYLRFILTVISFAALLLGGCTASFRMGKDPLPSNIPAVSQDVECRIYLRTGYNQIPSLPDLSKEKDLTPERLNVIQAIYIRQLRTFVADERTRLDDDYNKYIRRCLR